MALRSHEEVDDGYTRESFERAEEDRPEDMEPAAPDRSPWMICPVCSGEGKHSRHLGSFSREDIERDWDPEDWQAYLEGAYDRLCELCRGSGKIRERTYNEFVERTQEGREDAPYEPGYSGRYGY